MFHCNIVLCWDENTKSDGALLNYLHKPIYIDIHVVAGVHGFHISEESDTVLG